MISQVKQQDVDLWEVWIEYDQFNSKHFGVLYVIGEIMVDQSTEPVIRKSKQGDDGRQLRLLVPSRHAGRGRMKEVLYSEPIEDLSQYTSINIYAGDELIARFNEIEVLI
jgi:hypothetical protein